MKDCIHCRHVDQEGGTCTVHPWYTGVYRDEDSMRHYKEGAAAAFGLMGMAEAIRQRCTCKTLEELRAERGPGPRTWDEVCERCKGYP